MPAETASIFISSTFGVGAGVAGVLISLGQYKARLTGVELKVDGIEQKIDSLQNDMRAQFAKLVETRTMLDERTQSYSTTLIKRESPVALSKEGTKLLKASGSDKFVLENKNGLLKCLKRFKPQTAYDVQEMSKKVVQNYQNDANFRGLKNYVYEEGLDLKVIFIVMGIYLRDIALPLLGFELKDIDKDDPAKRS